MNKLIFITQRLIHTQNSLFSRNPERGVSLIVLRHVCMSEVTKANVTFLKYLIQMASGTGYMGSYCMTHTNPS